MKKIGIALKYIEGLALKLSSVFLILLVLLINVEVFGRSFFNYSTDIADEYGGYLYAWIVLLGSVHLLRSDKYLTMTFAIDRMGPVTRKAVELAGSVIGLAVALICLLGCYSVWHQSLVFGTKSSQISETRMLIPQLAMLIGYGMLSVAYVEEILCRLLGHKVRRSEDDEETYGVGEVS